MQDNLLKGEPLGNYSVNELKYVQKPVGRNIYKTGMGRPRKEEHVSYLDKVTCKICGKTVSRSNQSNHKKSQYHMAHERMNKKIREVLLD